MTIQSVSFDGTSYNTLKEPSPALGFIANVSWRLTASGSKARSVRLGPKLRKRGYRIWLQQGTSPDDEYNWDAFIETLNDFADTFTFVDHNGASFTARFLAPPVKIYDDDGDVLVDFEVEEVLT
jgi:hypothetical protein